MTLAVTRGQVGMLPLWFGLLGGPIAWGAHLGIGYLLVTLPCIGVMNAGAAKGLLYGLTVATALWALAAVAVAVWCWRRTGGRLGRDLGESGGPRGFLAAGGIMFSGISLLTIVVETLALPALNPCE